MKKTECINSFVQRNKIEIGILTVVFLIDLIYLSNTTANVPIMDYWRYGDEFLDEFFNGGLRFQTFWESINGQRAFLTYILFFINVKFFHWNTRTAIFFGAFITFFTGLLLLGILDKDESSSKERMARFVKCIAMIGISMLLFNYVQWEIKVIEFSAPFSVITLFVVFNMRLADRILNHLEEGYGKVIFFTILFGLSICFIYSAFFPAVAGAICICGAFHFFTHFKEDAFQYVGSYLIVGGGMLAAAAVYLAGINGVTGSDFNLSMFAQSILNGDFFKGFAVYLGSSILHVSFTERYGVLPTALAGCVVAVIYVAAIIIYLRNGDQIKSYFPVMLMIYTLLAGVLLSYGRGNVYGVAYMASSRYGYQSKMGLIGVLLIFNSSIQLREKVRRFSWSVLGKAIASGFLILALLASMAFEFRIAPYRRANYDALIQDMYEIDSREDEELEGFQANNPSQVRNTVQSMKKYRLGVFANLPPDGRFDQIPENGP